MCFSPTASFAAGAVLTGICLVTVRKVKDKKELPLALVPLFFGIQQLFEGVVWLSFDQPFLHLLATDGFAFFALLFWQIYGPFCAWSLEKILWRKKILQILMGLGAVVSLTFLYFMVKNGISSTIVQNCISYNLDYFPNPLLPIIYIVAACGSLFVSSSRFVNFMGVLIFGSVVVSLWFYFQVFFSVWCFFAAVLSGLIYLFFRKLPQK